MDRDAYCYTNGAGRPPERGNGDAGGWYGLAWDLGKFVGRRRTAQELSRGCTAEAVADAFPLCRAGNLLDNDQSASEVVQGMERGIERSPIAGRLGGEANDVSRRQ